jgi:hypothetical protein
MSFSYINYYLVLASLNYSAAIASLRELYRGTDLYTITISRDKHERRWCYCCAYVWSANHWPELYGLLSYDLRLNHAFLLVSRSLCAIGIIWRDNLTSYTTIRSCTGVSPGVEVSSTLSARVETHWPCELWPLSFTEVM